MELRGCGPVESSALAPGLLKILSGQLRARQPGKPVYDGLIIGFIGRRRAGTRAAENNVSRLYLSRVMGDNIN